MHERVESYASKWHSKSCGYKQRVASLDENEGYT